MNVVTEVRRAEDETPLAEVGVAEGPPEPKRPRWRSRNFRLLIIGVLLVVAGGVAVNWLLERWSHVSLDDSRIAATIVAVSSEVSGRITDVRVIAGDHVKGGDLIVGIDNEQAQLDMQILDAQIASIEAQQNQLRTQQDMIHSQVASRLVAGRAQLAAAEAAHRSSVAALDNARSQHQRVSTLADRKVVSTQQLDDAKAKLVAAEELERSTAAGIDTASANLSVIQADETQIAVLERQIATLETQKTALKAQREQKVINLSRTEIRAAFDSVIDATFVDAGEYVSLGTRLLMYHDPQKVWVDANVKETDFRRLKLGAPASISVDAYPDRTFHGQVVRLGDAATSQFALLPSPNPSGNFTKVTQRLPIRISIDQQDELLRPGMMVEVSIDVVD